MPLPTPTKLEEYWYWKREPCADRLVPDNTTKFGELLNEMTGWTDLYTDAQIARMRTRAGGVNRMRALFADPDTVLDEATRAELTALVNDLEDLGAHGWQGYVNVLGSFQSAGMRVERIFEAVEKKHRREIALVSGLGSCVCPECRDEELVCLCRDEEPPCLCPEEELPCTCPDEEVGPCPICFLCAVCRSEGVVPGLVENVHYKKTKDKARRFKNKARKTENRARETEKKAEETEKKAEENEKNAGENEKEVEDAEKKVEGKGKERATE